MVTNTDDCRSDQICRDKVNQKFLHAALIAEFYMLLTTDYGRNVLLGCISCFSNAQNSSTQPNFATGSGVSHI